MFPTCAPAGLSSAPAKQPQHPRHWRSPCAKRWVPVREVPVGLHDSNTLGARLGSQCAHNAGCQHDRASASLLITPSLPHHPAGSLLSLCSWGSTPGFTHQHGGLSTASPRAARSSRGSVRQRSLLSSQNSAASLTAHASKGSSRPATADACDRHALRLRKRSLPKHVQP